MEVQGGWGWLECGPDKTNPENLERISKLEVITNLIDNDFNLVSIYYLKFMSCYSISKIFHPNFDSPIIAATHWTQVAAARMII
jgi:hypothetical protein